MSIEKLLSQIGGAAEGITQGKRQWDYGRYGGGNPRYAQEIDNFVSSWDNIFNYLDVNDTDAINNAYIKLDEDYNDYTSRFPEKMFEYDLVKTEVTEMLDAFKGRAANIQASRLKLDELRNTLAGYLDADTVQLMINDYATDNPTKNNKDFRNEFVSNVAGIDKTIDDITKSLYLTTSQDTSQESYHKLRNNRFFNNNLLAIDDDTIALDILSAKNYTKALKGELLTGLDAMLLLDSGDPWAASHQDISNDSEKPYSLKWHVTNDEASQLKMVLNGDIEATDYAQKENLRYKQKGLQKQDAIENLKPLVKTFNHISAVKNAAMSIPGRDGEPRKWDDVKSDEIINFTRTDGTSYSYKDLKGEFTENILGGNYKSLPAEIRTEFESRMITNPNDQIALTKDLLQYWEYENLNSITDEDSRYILNWDDSESENPFPVELFKPDIYPNALKSILRGNDPVFSRKSAKYREYGGLDLVALNENSGLLDADDIEGPASGVVIDDTLKDKMAPDATVKNFEELNKSLTTNIEDYMLDGKYSKMPTLKRRAIDIIHNATVAKGLKDFTHTTADGDTIVINDKKSITDWVKTAEKEELINIILMFENASSSKEDIKAALNYLSDNKE